MSRSAKPSLSKGAGREKREEKKRSAQRRRIEPGSVQSVSPDFNGDLFKDSRLYPNVRTLAFVVVTSARESGLPLSRNRGGKKKDGEEEED